MRRTCDETPTACMFIVYSEFVLRLDVLRYLCKATTACNAVGQDITYTNHDTEEDQLQQQRPLMDHPEQSQADHVGFPLSLFTVERKRGV